MTTDTPGTGDADVGSRLEALDAEATTEHLAVYTAIAGELAARLDEPVELRGPYPNSSPHPGAPIGDGGARG